MLGCVYYSFEIGSVNMLMSLFQNTFCATHVYKNEEMKKKHIMRRGLNSMDTFSLTIPFHVCQTVSRPVSPKCLMDPCASRALGSESLLKLFIRENGYPYPLKHATN